MLVGENNARLQGPSIKMKVPVPLDSPPQTSSKFRDVVGDEPSKRVQLLPQLVTNMCDLRACKRNTRVKPPVILNKDPKENSLYFK